MEWNYKILSDQHQQAADELQKQRYESIKQIISQEFSLRFPDIKFTVNRQKYYEGGWDWVLSLGSSNEEKYAIYHGVELENFADYMEEKYSVVLIFDIEGVD